MEAFWGKQSSVQPRAILAVGRGLGTRGMGWMVRSSRVAMSVEKQRCVSYCAWPIRWAEGVALCWSFWNGYAAHLHRGLPDFPEGNSKSSKDTALKRDWFVGWVILWGCIVGEPDGERFRGCVWWESKSNRFQVDLSEPFPSSKHAHNTKRHLDLRANKQPSNNPPNDRAVRVFFNQGSPEWHRTEREDSHHISSLLSVLSLSACSLTPFSISWVADQFHLVLSGVREGLFPSIISESWLCVCCLFSGLVSPGWRPVCLSSSTNLPKLPFNALLSNTENNRWWIPQTIYTLWGDGLYFLLVLSLPSDSCRVLLGRNDRQFSPLFQVGDPQSIHLFLTRMSFHTLHHLPCPVLFSSQFYNSLSEMGRSGLQRTFKKWIRRGFTQQHRVVLSISIHFWLLLGKICFLDYWQGKNPYP